MNKGSHLRRRHRSIGENAHKMAAIKVFLQSTKEPFLLDAQRPRLLTRLGFSALPRIPNNEHPSRFHLFGAGGKKSRAIPHLSPKVSREHGNE
ncbi:hypothetical protein CEXT_56531 [Caerostris extrusa]|uniref:Uncharacterized protein n=1 Tax=Caerostris extrusa TaxID=172846 RepID=A0AAV4T2D4_CAEEX|nr:hypothetical protein CEXT_56531 [Caerostris extrusa]